MTEAFAGGEGATPMTENARELLSPDKRAEIPAPVMEKIVAALSDSVSATFVWSIIPAGLALVCVLMMGNKGMKDIIGKRDGKTAKTDEIRAH